MRDDPDRGARGRAAGPRRAASPTRNWPGRGRPRTRPRARRRGWRARRRPRQLALVHISSRYHVGAVLDEAREEFPSAFAPRDFDLVEIPFPERGEPRLVKNGARERPRRSASPSPRLTKRRSEVRDRLSDLGGVVLLEEVLGGQHDRVLEVRGRAGMPRVARPAPGRARPRRAAPGSRGPRAPRGRSRCLSSRQLEPAHDLQERTPPVAQAQQRDVRVDLGAGDTGALRDPDASRRSPRTATVETRAARPRRCRGSRTDASATAAGSPPTSTSVLSTVSDSTRSGVADRPFEADRPADVVDDEVDAIEPECVDRCRRSTSRVPTSE